METKKYVCLYRVSTRQQGLGNGMGTGYGIESQKQILARFLATVPQSEMIAEFTEIEGATKVVNRIETWKAIGLCQQTGATLAISKTDRLLRSIEFLVMLRQSGISIYFCDNPSCDKFSLTILCAMAEKERDDCSLRTKNGLKIAAERLKAQGRRLGNPNPENALQAAYAQMRVNREAFAQSVYPHILAAKADKKGRYNTLRDIADYLKLQNIRTAKGNTDWQPSSIARIIETMAASC